MVQAQVPILVSSQKNEPSEISRRNILIADPDTNGLLYDPAETIIVPNHGGSQVHSPVIESTAKHPHLRITSACTCSGPI